MPTLYCIDCNREIHHRGRCLLCNTRAKERREAQHRYALEQIEA